MLSSVTPIIPTHTDEQCLFPAAPQFCATHAGHSNPIFPPKITSPGRPGLLFAEHSSALKQAALELSIDFFSGALGGFFQGVQPILQGFYKPLVA